MKSIAKRRVQERAALLAAQDDLSDAQIAQQCAIDRRTLTRWKTRPEFQAQIEQHRMVRKQEREAKSVAKLKARFRCLNSRWWELREIVEERARSREMRNVPGGQTGLLYCRQKTFRSAGQVHVIRDYYLDVKLLQAFRKLEVQAAKESGQWGKPLGTPPWVNFPAVWSTGRPLSGKRERVAELAAEDQLSDAEIADCCRISRRMLSRWRWEPEFQARIEEYRRRRYQTCESDGIGDKRRRLIALNERWGNLNRIMLERAASPEMRDAPGGDTGLACRRQTVQRIGYGRAIVVPEFRFDTALSREFLKHEMQAAKELGQVKERGYNGGV